jgi:hypothetical protein
VTGQSSGFVGVFANSRNLIYRAVSHDDNHSGDVPRCAGGRARWRACRPRRNTALPGMVAEDGQNRILASGKSERRASGAAGFKERGRRRTRQDQISLGLKIAGEIADLKDPHRTKKTCFFCRTGFRKSELFRNTIQPFDLMSRRHPLSSTRASGWKLLLNKQIVQKARVTCRHQAAGNFSEAKIHFFFLATLRVFLAVFFTALFAFFAFLAFLAMLPS